MKPTVLIVDDEKPTRDGLRAALEDKYETFVAKDAARGRAPNARRATRCGTH